MSLVYSRDDVSEKALYGIDEQHKERRRSRLREQRDDLLAALKAVVDYVTINGTIQFGLSGNDGLLVDFGADVSAKLDASLALIERIEKGSK